MSIADATTVVQVTSRTLTRWAKNREVAATKVGREWRVSLAEVIEKARGHES